MFEVRGPSGARSWYEDVYLKAVPGAEPLAAPLVAASSRTSTPEAVTSARAPAATQELLATDLRVRGRLQGLDQFDDVLDVPENLISAQTVRSQWSPGLQRLCYQTFRLH